MTDIKRDENDVEYYAPDLGAAKPLNIPDISEQDVDNFETKLDEKVIFQRVAKDLYKYPVSAVRELLVNAIGHGARKANEKYGKDNAAYVEVKLHPHDRSLTITDVRGMGMTHKHIISLMSFVGRSGNMDSETAGQFGMGYFSHLKIADSCIVNTKVREPYEYKGKTVTSMSYLNNKGWQWQKLNTTDEEVDLEYPGTSISLTMNEDADVWDVIKTIKQVAKYSDVLVKLILEDDYNKIPAGEIALDQISNLKEIHKVVKDQEVIELDDEDVYFKAVMQKDNYGNLSHDGEKVLLLARVPISVDGLSIPSFTGYVLNIKNERKFMPQPDRERLAAKSETALKEKLEELFKKHFGSLKAVNAEDIDALPYRYPIIYMRQIGLERFFNKPTKDFISSLVDHVVKHINYDKVKISTEYGANHNLLQVLAYRKDALIVYNKAIAPILAVQKYCVENNVTEKQFIRIDPVHTSKIALSLLEQWNVMKIKEYMIENKIKAKSNSKHTSGITLHTHKGYTRKTEKYTSYDDVDFTKTVWIKGALKPWIKLLSYNSTELCITKYTKGAVEYADENEEPLITDATLYGMKDIDIITSKGKSTMSTWYKSAKKLLETGYSNRHVNVYSVTPEEMVQTERMLKSLEDADTIVNRSSYDKTTPLIKVNNAMVIINQNECVIIHDTKGNEIKLPFNENFGFITNAYDLIKNGGTEITDSIREQMTKIVLPDEKMKTHNQLYSTSPFYDNEINMLTYHATGTELSKSEHWKAFNLQMSDYYGIKNKFVSKYGWKENYDTVYLVMDLIKEYITDNDSQQMIFRGIYNSDYTDFCRSLGFNHYVSTARTDVQLDAVKDRIRPLIKNIAEILPKINKADSFDIFVKTRHLINKLNHIMNTPNNYPWMKSFAVTSTTTEILKHVRDVIVGVNSNVTIHGKFTEFINEFVKDSNAQVTQNSNSITIMCNPKSVLQIKDIVQLHSTMELAEIKPNKEQLVLVFKPYPKDANVSNLHYETSNKCPCGCSNVSTVRLSKLNTNVGDKNNDDD